MRLTAAFLLNFLCVAIVTGKRCSEFTETCPAGLTKRGVDDGHEAGATWSADQCCYDTCSSVAPSACTAPKVYAEHASCWGGAACTAAECCKRYCTSFSNETCTNGGIKNPYLQPFGGVWSESSCCMITCASFANETCPAGKVKRGTDDMHVPSGGVWSESECCQEDRSCAGNNHVCSGDLVLKPSDDNPTCSDEAGVVTCSDDDCCTHPMDDFCQSDAALECSTCAKYGPCLSSVDPHCIRQEALDCLYCDQVHNVTQCAACAPEYDVNCVGYQQYDGLGCDAANFEYMVPYRFTEECYVIPPFTSGGYQVTNFTAKTHSRGCDATCATCEDTQASDPADLIAQVDVCDEDGDDSSRLIGNLDISKPAPACPGAAPCGPAACVPGVDPKCIVFTVFASLSTCSVVDFNLYDTVGDYHAFAIGDDTCRVDGGGRSFYKMSFDAEQDSGTGLIGCTDSACSVGCTDVAMVRATCSTPLWANSLQLVASLDPSEFVVDMDDLQFSDFSVAAALNPLKVVPALLVALAVCHGVMMI